MLEVQLVILWVDLVAHQWELWWSYSALRQHLLAPRFPLETLFSSSHNGHRGRGFNELPTSILRRRGSNGKDLPGRPPSTASRRPAISPLPRNCSETTLPFSTNGIQIASAEGVIQRLQGTMIGQQAVHISWGRSPVKQDVAGAWGQQMDQSQWNMAY